MFDPDDEGTAYLLKVGTYWYIGSG